jgi:hypothetical protein
LTIEREERSTALGIPEHINSWTSMQFENGKHESDLNGKA